MLRIGTPNPASVYNTLQKKTVEKEKAQMQQQETSSLNNFVKPSLDHIKANFISFKATPNKGSLDISPVENFLNKLTPEDKQIWDKAVDIAKKMDSKELVHSHLGAALLTVVKDSLAKGEDDKTGFSEFLLKSVFQGDQQAFSENIESVIKGLDKAITFFTEELDQKVPKSDSGKGPETINSSLIKLLKNVEGQLAEQMPEGEPYPQSVLPQVSLSENIVRLSQVTVAEAAAQAAGGEMPMSPAGVAPAGGQQSAEVIVNTYLNHLTEKDAKTFEDAVTIALEHHNTEVTPLHLLKVAINRAIDDYDVHSDINKIPDALSQLIPPEYETAYFSEDNTKPFIKSLSEKVDKLIDTLPKAENGVEELDISPEMVKVMNGFNTQVIPKLQEVGAVVKDDMIFGIIHSAKNDLTSQVALDALVKKDTTDLDNLLAGKRVLKMANVQGMDQMQAQFFNDIDKKLFDKAVEVAKEHQSAQLSPLHILKAGINYFKEHPEEQNMVIRSFTPDSLDNSSKRSETKEKFMSHVLENVLPKLDETIEKLPKISNDTNYIQYSHNFIAQLNSMAESFAQMAQKQGPGSLRVENFLLSTALNTKNDPIESFCEDLLDFIGNNISKKDKKFTTLTDKNTNELFYSDYYQKTVEELETKFQAKHHVIIPHEANDIQPELLIESFAKSVKDGNLRQLTPDNCEVVVLDSMHVHDESIVSSLRRFIEDDENPDKEKIIFIKDFEQIFAAGEKEPMPIKVIKDILETPGVNIAGLLSKNIYERLTSDQASPFGEPIHVIESKEMLRGSFHKIPLQSANPDNTQKLIQALLETHKDIIAPEGVSINNDAVKMAIERSNWLPGVQPQKAIDLIKDAYFSKEAQDGKLSAQDIETYVVTRPELFPVCPDKPEQFNVLYDTKLTLDDVAGANATKEHAKEIIDMVKHPENFMLDPKKSLTNAIIHGSQGSGKRHLAKAIAGELKAPVIDVTLSDFFRNPVSDMFKFAVDKARQNDNKTAVILVEDFDNFATDESYIHKRSQMNSMVLMPEIKKELENIKQLQDVKILFLAASEHPEYLAPEMTDYPGMFSEKIYIENPAYHKESRQDILTMQIEKRNIAVAGSTPKEKAETIDQIADMAEYLNAAQLIQLLNQSIRVAATSGREDKSITLADANEAYLRMTAGRAHEANITDTRKHVVTAHEGGHAITRKAFADAMSDVVAEDNKDWKLPSRINFITLDPRANYGGAVYSKSAFNNSELTFEKVFSNLVCSYGGNAVETTKFGFDGSWGISSDLLHVTDEAYQATTRMGMGPNTGSFSLAYHKDLKDANIERINDDVRNLTKAAKAVSNLIVKSQLEFIDQFEKEHWDKVGTGNNTISGDDFVAMHEKWINDSQHPERKEKYETLKQTIRDIMLIARTSKDDIRLDRYLMELKADKNL